ncbi:MAG: type II toxin-antitoxin system HicB family antitoxin [Ruminococcus sp.]|jgi:predicted RNase H-like HicB family nuclease|nr:type II toxin-antitoxin system HicB family antitoxin [Ruminococcus sp.]
MKYVYPAVFHYNANAKNWKYVVEFPDLEACMTEENTFPDAITMAEDAASIWLCNQEDNGLPIPEPSKNLKTESPDDLISYIKVDTDLYRRQTSNVFVKKTLTLPRWLNEKALQAGVNFSQTLQEALKSKLNIA